MDASDAVDLARVATCSRALHDLFSDGVVKASIEHCREASNRANLMEAQALELSHRIDTVAMERNQLLETVETMTVDLAAAREQCAYWYVRARELNEELVEAKRARTG